MDTRRAWPTRNSRNAHGLTRFAFPAVEITGIVERAFQVVTAAIAARTMVRMPFMLFLARRPHGDAGSRGLLSSFPTLRRQCRGHEFLPGMPSEPSLPNSGAGLEIDKQCPRSAMQTADLIGRYCCKRGRMISGRLESNFESR